MSETKDGVDVAIETVGAPATFDICQRIVLPGGHVAKNCGVRKNLTRRIDHAQV